MIDLRPYQAIRADEAARRVVSLRRAWRSTPPGNVRGCWIGMATGVGKTRTALGALERIFQALRGGTALWLVDLKPLIDQTAPKAAEFGIPVEVRTIQGVRNPIKPGDYDVIVLDEAHKFLTDLRTRILLDSGTPLLGLTATPTTGGGKHVEALFGEAEPVGGPYTIGAAIDDGWLCDARVKRVELQDLDLSRVRKTKQDLNKKDLAEAMNVPAHNAEIVRRWIELAGAGGELPQTNFFAVDTEHADALAAEVMRQLADYGYGTRAGEVVAAIHSNLPGGDAGARLERLRGNGYVAVTSVMMVAEGFDHPPLKCGVFARAIRSERLLVQALGRFLRPWRGEDALILDAGGGYEGLDLASVFDVVQPKDGEPSVTGEGEGAEPMEDDGIPMLSEVISTVRDLNLFRRACAGARRMDGWHRTSGHYAISTPEGVVAVGRGRSRGMAAVAHLTIDRGTWYARCETIASDVPEPDAYRLAESWLRTRFHPRSVGVDGEKAVEKAVDRWFRYRTPTSVALAERMQTEFGLRPEEIPARHGVASHRIRQLYAMQARGVAFPSAPTEGARP